MRMHILFTNMIIFLLFASLVMIIPIIVDAIDFPDPDVSASESSIKTYVSTPFSVDFTLVNNGAPSSSDSFLSISISHQLDIVSFSSNPFLPDLTFTIYDIGEPIWNNEGQQIPAEYILLDIHDHPYGSSESVTITIDFQTTITPSTEEWIRYRSSMLPEGITYPTDVPTMRDPTVSSYVDQQGYPVHLIDVTVSEMQEGEWFAEVTHEPYDSDGDGNNDAVRIGMNADTVEGTMTVHVYNVMYRNFGSHGFVDDDSQEWTIHGTDVEWEYSFLYVSMSHPYGNYEVILHLYDDSNNFEDEYIFYVDLYPGEANPRKWIEDVRITYLQYDETGPVPIEWPNVVMIEINADTEGGEEQVEVDGNLTNDAGNVLDYSSTGTWTIHGTDVEWEEFYLWLDQPNPPGYYWVDMWLYTAVRPWNLEDSWKGLVGPLYPTNYEPPPSHHQLTISVTPTESGTTIPEPNVYSVDHGQYFEVSAYSAPGYVFDSWELNGAPVGDQLSYTVYMDSDYTLTAKFSPVQINIRTPIQNHLVGRSFHEIMTDFIVDRGIIADATVEVEATPSDKIESVDIRLSGSCIFIPDDTFSTTKTASGTFAGRITIQNGLIIVNFIFKFLGAQVMTSQGMLGDIVDAPLLEPILEIAEITVTDVYGGVHSENFNTPLPTAGPLLSSLAPTPSTGAIALCPIDILVVDSQSRRVGGLYENGQFVEILNEIPGAYYLRNNISNDLKCIFLPFSEEGYALQLYGNSTGSFNLTSYTLMDPAFNGNFSTVEDVIETEELKPYILAMSLNGSIELCEPMLWDITGFTMWVPDGKCDMRDIGLVASLFNSIEGDGTYDVKADITGPDGESDGKIDMRDIGTVAIHFGDIYP